MPTNMGANSSLNAGSIGGVVGQVRAERLRFLILRAGFAVTVAITLFFLAWVMPGSPIGLASGDYDATTLIAIALAVGAAVAWVAFVSIILPQFQREPISQFLHVLFGGHQMIRGGAQFVRRLEHECRRARRDRRHVLSLIVVDEPAYRQKRPDLMELGGEPHATALLLRSLVRTKDIVATPTEYEVWLLMLAADVETRDRVVQRLQVELDHAGWLESDGAQLRIGTSTFGIDGETAQSLLSTAKQRLSPVMATEADRAA